MSFAAQWSKGAGPGAWYVGFSTLLCFAVAALAIKRGEQNITISDSIAFVIALTGIVLWYATEDPLWAVALASLIDILACYPTLRKTYLKPHEEAVFMYAMAAFRAALSLPALVSYSLVTVLFPATLVFTSSLIALTILWRRKALTLAQSEKQESAPA